MRAFWHGAVVHCLLIFYLSTITTAQSDQVVAERILGSQWKELSRRAGMIFAGTVLNTQSPGIQAVTGPLAIPGTSSAVQLTFRVDSAIAGVQAGQIVTIHEWTGAWSLHRPMRSGQRILIFLYPPSRLGLTSPVGGARGQVDLDARGKYISQGDQRLAGLTLMRSGSPAELNEPVDAKSVSVAQLERAIRGARLE